MCAMEDAFVWVMVVVVVISVVAAIASFATRDGVYSQIGSGGLTNDRQDGRGPTEAPAPTSAAQLRERDEEVRQMLEARNRRRAARGQEPLDVEAELAALTRPQVDRALLLEIRELVEARNARRVRRGQEPLDVEAEIERQVREIGG